MKDIPSTLRQAATTGFRASIIYAFIIGAPLLLSLGGATRDEYLAFSGLSSIVFLIFFIYMNTSLESVAKSVGRRIIVERFAMSYAFESLAGLVVIPLGASFSLFPLGLLGKFLLPGFGVPGLDPLALVLYCAETAVFIVVGLLVRSAFNEMAQSTQVTMFKTAGSAYLIASALSVVIGEALFVAAYAILAIAFLSLHGRSSMLMLSALEASPKGKSRLEEFWFTDREVIRVKTFYYNISTGIFLTYLAVGVVATIALLLLNPLFGGNNTMGAMIWSAGLDLALFGSVFLYLRISRAKFPVFSYDGIASSSTRIPWEEIWGMKIKGRRFTFNVGHKKYSGQLGKGKLSL